MTVRLLEAVRIVPPVALQVNLDNHNLWVLMTAATSRLTNSLP
jgi:hypothetical protein